MSSLNSRNCAFMPLTCKREVKYLKILVSHRRICSDSCSKTCLQVFLRSSLLIWLGPWQGTAYHMPRSHATTLPCRTPHLILKDNLLAPDDVPTLPNRSRVRFPVDVQFKAPGSSSLVLPLIVILCCTVQIPAILSVK